MSRKFLPVVLVLTGAGLFLAFQSHGRAEDDNPKLKYTKVLRNVGVLLEKGHYSPKKIDDDFSKQVLKKFTEDLDDEKDIFLQSDIESFRKYETKIDDEIHGSPLESFFTVNDLYLKRLNETAELYKGILSKPFDFSKDETVMLDPDKLAFPKTADERAEVWRKRLKYLVLSRYADMQNDREKNKDKKDFKYKADSTLEREARDAVRKQIERYFTTKKTHENIDENFSTFINAITWLMDPHTEYFPPIDKRTFDESMRGSFFGIGAVLKEDDGKIKIGSLVNGMPAAKSGEIKVDDEIIKIAQGDNEPVDVTGYAVTDAVKLIRGAEKGSVVKLTIRKDDGTIKVVALKRDEIKLEDTFAKSAIINGDHKVGYISLREFYVDFENPNGAKCSEDVAKEIQKLKAENVEGIILDLRGNGGGSLPEVIKMVGLFIEDGPVCQVKGRDERPTQLKDRDKSVLYTGPLTVMVDELSASASEIFAAAIQDYKRGIIIGSSSTYGKGTVQRNIPLTPEAENPLFAGKDKEEDLGYVKLTLQKFYRINGGATQLKGVTPDIILPDWMEYKKFREKDNTSALQWDEIPQADYKTWTSTASEDAVVKEAYSQLNTSTTFTKIKSCVDWLQQYSEKEYSLNITKYKEDQKRLKDTYKQLEEASKLSKSLNVTNNTADLAEIKSTQEKIDRNSKWLKSIGDDVYVDETVKVVNNMINQGNTAKRN